MKNLKQETISGFIYRFLERGLSQFVIFIVQVVLARILLPDNFGTIALLVVFIAVMNVIVSYGYGNSLIVSKKTSNIDFSTCLYFGFTLSLIIYIIIFFTAPLISSFFYDGKDMTLLVKIMALKLPFSAIYVVYQSYAAKCMKFKWLFWSTFTGVVVSGILSITMALFGYGLWALATQYVSEIIVSTITILILSKWKPLWAFSINRLNKIYKFGWKILVVGLIDTSFGQIRSLILARQYSRAALAYYNRGFSFPSFSSSFVEQTVGGVLLPALSNCRGDKIIMKAICRRVTKISTFVVSCVMCILAAIASPLVDVILTAKWLPCVAILQIGCLAYVLRPLQIINSCVIRAFHKGGLLLWLDVLKKMIGITLLLASMRYGVIAIAWSIAITNILSVTFNLYPNKKLLNYRFKEQICDILGNLIFGVFIGVLVWSLSFLGLSSFYLLILQLIAALGLVVIFSELLKLSSFVYIKETFISEYSKLQKR